MTDPSPLALLEPLLQDPAVTEIMIDGPDRILVERQGPTVEDSGLKFPSEAALRAAIDAVLALGGAGFQSGQTICDTRLADNSRALAVLPPTAVNGPYLVLRKVFRRPMTVQSLIDYRSLTAEVWDLLLGALRARRNVAVAGGTGSGKTTILNMLGDTLPAADRVVVVENVVELNIRHPRLVRLSADLSKDASYVDVIVTAAKMRPDRLVFGELHGAEAIHILSLLSTGHDGSLFTLHANSPENALTRIEAMCLMADMGLGIGEIRDLIASSVNVISIQQRMPNGTRKLTQITEVLGLENDRYVLQPLMRYNPETDAFERLGQPSWA